MARTEKQNNNPMGPLIPDLDETAIRRDRALSYSGSIALLREEDLASKLILPAVTDPVFAHLREVEIWMYIPIEIHLGSRAVEVVARTLYRINPIIVAASAGETEEQIHGYTARYGSNQCYKALASTEYGRQITKYEMAGTLFHELTHAADYDCDRVNPEEYREIFERYRQRGILDPYFEAVIDQGDDVTELVVRAFQAVLLGIPESSKSEAEFLGNISGCREWLPDLVELVETDFFKIFAERRYLRTRSRTEMSATVTTFRPLKPWAGWYH